MNLAYTCPFREARTDSLVLMQPERQNPPSLGVKLAPTGKSLGPDLQRHDTNKTHLCETKTHLYGFMGAASFTGAAVACPVVGWL